MDDFEIVESDVLDEKILSDVDGCLKKEVTGEDCNLAFRNENIIDYCSEINLKDPCYAIAAAMNNVEEYCYDIENEPLLAKCLERFQA